MTTKDFYNNHAVVRALSAAAAGTTGTGRTSAALDTRGYLGKTFHIHYAGITATAATITPTVLEGDTTGGSFTSVSDDDLLGTEAAAAIAAGTPRASGSNMHITKKLGYKGAKRYVKLKLVPTATAGTIVEANLVLTHPNLAPVS